MQFRPPLVAPTILSVVISALLAPAGCLAATPSAPPPSAILSLFETSPLTPPSALTPSSAAPEAASDSLPDAPQPQNTPAASVPPATPQTAAPKQTKRILFIVPNFRSVSADEKLPPITTKDKFKIAFLDSFDYSAFIEVGILAGMGQIQNSEPEFHQGAAGYGRYYWHSFADNLDGDLWVEALLPTATREDPRYYTLGHGGIIRRTVYSVTRLAVTRNNNGNATPNFSEVIGNGTAAGISQLYYPSSERSWTKTGQRWVLQVGIDGLSNILKEFWPDINDKLFHDKY